MEMLDPQAVLDVSRRFYRQHNLADWTDALPERAELDDAARRDFSQAAKHGLTRAFAFPPFDLQMQTLDRLIDETARKHAPISDNQQYAEPFLADTWTKTPNGKVLQRTDELGPRLWGPYLHVFAPKPIQQAWGRTARQIQEWLDAKGWQGLTVPEYLVLQRCFCEQHRDHRFFDEPEDDSGMHALWLIDSMTGKECAVAVGSHRGINLQACSAGNRDSRRATVAGVVVALGCPHS
jgi:hypothetical protein